MVSFNFMKIETNKNAKGPIIFCRGLSYEKGNRLILNINKGRVYVNMWKFKWMSSISI